MFWELTTPQPIGCRTPGAQILRDLLMPIQYVQYHIWHGNQPKTAKVRWGHMGQS